MNKQDRGAEITITARAAKRIKEVLAAASSEGHELRVKVVGGGCSGLQYKLDLDIERAGDRIFETDKAKVLVDPKSLLYLNGTEIDYQAGLTEAGLVIRRPSTECPCRCNASSTVHPETPDVPNIW